MINIIKYLLILPVLLFSDVSASTVDGKSNKTESKIIDYNSLDWLNNTRFPWMFPIFQLKSSNVASRRYNRTFKCTGILVHRNAIFASKLCIEENESYVIALNGMVISSDGTFKSLPYSYHHRLYPAEDYQSYRLATIEYKEKNFQTISFKNHTIPGLVILFFDSSIHFTDPVRLFKSPKYYEIYSKKINRNCARVSMMTNFQRQIFIERSAERIIAYDNLVELYRSVQIRSHRDHLTEITYIAFDDFVPVFAATQSNFSGSAHHLLGSALVCRDEKNNPVLAGILISTTIDGLNLYAIVGDAHDWIRNKGYEFGKRTDRLTYSQSDLHETRYLYDLP